MIFVECVAFILIKNNQILLEKRKTTNLVDPGLVAIPGGHCEANESLEDTLFREIKEELGITPLRFNYLCTLIHQSQETEKINYFVVSKWDGDIQNNEADAIFWIDFKESYKIDIETDKVAINEYFRVFKEH